MSNALNMQTSNGGLTSRPGKWLAIYMFEKGKGYLLVKPNLSCGAFGQTSIWVGVSDQKLYVRKVQRESSQGNDVRDGPQPADVASHSAGFPPGVWSTITEYIDGLTLQSTIEWHVGNQKLIPEEEIWECGASLLEVVRDMQYPAPDGPNAAQRMAHRDIFPRNLMVEPVRESLPPEIERVTRYWLIDFGRATRRTPRVGEKRHHKDICQVVAIMIGMIQGNLDYENWTWRAVKKYMSTRWPYSAYLWNAMMDLNREVEDAVQNDGLGLAKKRIQHWLEYCMMMSEHCRRPYAKARWRSPPTLYTKSSPQSPVPILMQDKQEMADLLSGDHQVWGPYQYAWVDSETLSLAQVEDEVYWGRQIPDARGGVRLDLVEMQKG